MTYKEAIEYIHSISWTGSRPGLSRIGELCRRIGNIQDKLKVVHIAGTNGKGSVSAMLTGICRAANMKVGTFTSPFVYRFNERVCVNKKPIGDDELADIISRLKPIVRDMTDPPTEFELITALGFIYFYEQKCDIVILECGMGGRLDSTNIISAPALSVITGVALDHTAFLGDTTEKIAYEKAGIIKPGVPVVLGSADEAAKAVIRAKAAETGSKIIECDYSRIYNTELSLDGSRFSVSPFEKSFFTPLAGAYQPKNALIAITSAQQLGFSESSIYRGLCETRWPARFEVISHDPVVIYDGGHNPDGVRETVNTVKSIFQNKVNVLTGVMRDKDYCKMADMICEIADNVFCITPENPRALRAEEYADVFGKAGIASIAFSGMYEGLLCAYESSKREGKPLVVMGSLYMYRSFRDSFDKIKAN